MHPSRRHRPGQGQEGYEERRGLLGSARSRSGRRSDAEARRVRLQPRRLHLIPRAARLTFSACHGRAGRSHPDWLQPIGAHGFALRRQATGFPIVRGLSAGSWRREGPGISFTS
ncbi:hypothetical protein MPLDJ20_260150 [Mesorhizobium plurifarium]|uniref:Uncharacterized protein n=1 Tax=Mesorhizobium plurifarium TaxID=69974 RepID=A0A090FE75_MESPL|nr:hypothetical protein MPLDJ20_260150 [Mesorhizobium plurifarium]